MSENSETQQAILQTKQQGRVLRLTLNRPEKRNALNSELCRRLVDAINHADRDPHIGAIVLTGAGNTFSSGMDLNEARDGHYDRLNNVHEQLFTLSSRLGKPLVGVVNGPSLGGGLGLVANCHIVIASDQATFGLPEIRLGLWPFLVFRAMELALGERRAVELALTARTFSAGEAREMGLAQEVTPDFDRRAMEIANGLAESSPSAIRNGLNFVHEVRGKDWASSSAIARRIRDELFQSPDFQEGIRAFREKRQPKWPSIEEHGPITPQDIADRHE